VLQQVVNDPSQASPASLIPLPHTGGTDRVGVAVMVDVAVPDPVGDGIPTDELRAEADEGRGDTDEPRGEADDTETLAATEADDTETLAATEIDDTETLATEIDETETLATVIDDTETLRDGEIPCE